MTRTDRILTALRDELERRRAEVDGDDVLRSIQIVVLLDARDGWPREVLFRTESKRRMVAVASRGTA